MPIGERRTHTDIAFPEDEVKLAKKMLDTLRTTMEFLYYLMEHRNKASFSMLLLSTEGLKLELMLQKWKRQTDILFEIDKVNNVYVIISQVNDHEGVKKFAEILVSNINMNGGHETYCVISEPQTTEVSVQEIIFKIVEKYIIIKEEKKVNQVYFTA
jgi:hypothetical protein